PLYLERHLEDNSEYAKKAKENLATNAGRVLKEAEEIAKILKENEGKIGKTDLERKLFEVASQSNAVILEMAKVLSKNPETDLFHSKEVKREIGILESKVNSLIRLVDYKQPKVGNGHNITAKVMAQAVEAYKNEPYIAEKFKKLAGALGILGDYLIKSGKITGPPVVAYRKNGQVIWNLTEKEIETILTQNHYDKETIAFVINQIKLHESQATEEEGIQAQAEVFRGIITEDGSKKVKVTRKLAIVTDNIVVSKIKTSFIHAKEYLVESGPLGIYDEVYPDGGGDSKSQSGESVEVDGWLEQLKALRPYFNSDPEIARIAKKLITKLNRVEVKDKYISKAIKDELTWWVSNIKDDLTIAEIIAGFNERNHLMVPEIRSALKNLNIDLGKLRIAFKIGINLFLSRFGNIRAILNEAPLKTTNIEELKVSDEDIKQQLKKNWYHHAYQKYPRMQLLMKERLLALNRDKLYQHIERIILEKKGSLELPANVRIKNIIVGGSYLYGIEEIGITDLDILVIVEGTKGYFYRYKEGLTLDKGVILEEHPIKVDTLDLSIRSLDTLDKDWLMMVYGTGIILFGPQLFKGNHLRPTEEDMLVNINVLMGKADEWWKGKRKEASLNKRYDKAYKRLADALVVLSQIVPGVKFDPYIHFHNLSLYQHGEKNTSSDVLNKDITGIIDYIAKEIKREASIRVVQGVLSERNKIFDVSKQKKNPPNYPNKNKDHHITSEAMFKAAEKHRKNIKEAAGFKILAEVLKVLEEYLAKSGKIKGPPVVAYRKANGQVIWNLTEKEIETILTQNHYDKETIAFVINQIKLHESQATEEEGIQVQAHNISTISKKETDESSVEKLIPDAIEQGAIDKLRAQAEIYYRGIGKAFKEEMWPDQVQFALWLSRTTKENPHFAELPSAKGKTLGYVLAAYILYKKLRSAGKNDGIFVFVTDYYFAEEHGKFARDILAGLSVNVGFFTPTKGNAKAEKEARNKLYASSDIIYTIFSIPEFDRLAEEMALSVNEQVQLRRKWVRLFDEVQKTVIEEAHTPLIITGGKIIDPEFKEFAETSKLEGAELEKEFTKTLNKISYKAKELAGRVKKESKGRKLFPLYKEDKEARRAFLTSWGRRWLKGEIRKDKDTGGDKLDNWELRVNNALTVKAFLSINEEFIKRNKEIILISPQGGLLLGRRLGHGLDAALTAEMKGKVQPQRQILNETTLKRALDSELIAGGSATVDEEDIETTLENGVEVLRFGDNKEFLTKLSKFISIFKKTVWFKSLVNRILEHNIVADPVIIDTESPKFAKKLHKALLKKVDVNKIQIIDARVSDQPAVVEEMIRKAGELGMITIVTGVAALGIDPHLSKEAIKQGKTFWAISTYPNESVFDEYQFGKRVRRSDDEKGEWEACWSAEVFRKYPKLAQEVNAVLARKTAKTNSITGEEIVGIINLLRSYIREQRHASIKETNRRGNLLEEIKRKQLKQTQIILVLGLFEILPSSVKKAIEEKLSAEQFEDLKKKLKEATPSFLSYIHLTRAEFLTKVSNLGKSLGDLSLDNKDSAAGVQFHSFAEFKRNVDHLNKDWEKDAQVKLFSYISYLTGISPEELKVLINTENNNHKVKNIARRLYIGLSLAVAAIGGAAFYLSFVAQGILNSTALSNLISFLGLGIISGLGLFVSGTLAIALVIATITLQRSFLNRIHAARKTGEALSLFINGADNTRKGFIKALTDISYTLSNVLTYASIIGTLGSLAFAISMNLSLLLIPATLFATGALVLTGITTVLGRKNLKDAKIIPVTREQRFISSVLSGSVFTAIVALLASVTVALPITIITGITLGAIGIIGMHILPAKITGDKLIKYRDVLKSILAGIGLGASLYTGLILVFTYGIITAPAAVLIGKYAFILTGLAVAIAGVRMARALISIRSEATLNNNSNKKKIALRTAFDVLATNITRVIPVALAVLSFVLAGQAGIVSLNILGPVGLGIIIALTIGYAVIAYFKPQYTTGLLSIGIGLGNATSFALVSNVQANNAAIDAWLRELLAQQVTDVNQEQLTPEMEEAARIIWENLANQDNKDQEDAEDTDTYQVQPTGVERDSEGRPVKVTYANGITVEYTYNADGTETIKRYDAKGNLLETGVGIYEIVIIKKALSDAEITELNQYVQTHTLVVGETFKLSTDRTVRVVEEPLTDAEKVEIAQYANTHTLVVGQTFTLSTGRLVRVVEEPLTDAEIAELNQYLQTHTLVVGETFKLSNDRTVRIVEDPLTPAEKAEIAQYANTHTLVVGETFKLSTDRTVRVVNEPLTNAEKAEIAQYANTHTLVVGQNFTLSTGRLVRVVEDPLTPAEEAEIVQYANTHTLVVGETFKLSTGRLVRVVEDPLTPAEKAEIVQYANTHTLVVGDTFTLSTGRVVRVTESPLTPAEESEMLAYFAAHPELQPGDIFTLSTGR
ncbi:MAG: hypothetical protein NTW64_00200, partial [Candidatus Omnitrophica bacterium]|nr:hypothetical protein [Candidatus Omnitrophota bacterium]